MPKSSRSYLLTISADIEDNGYSKEEVEEKLNKYTYVGQLEKGEKTNEVTEKQFLHWQVYIENDTCIKFDTLRAKFDKKPIHIEKRKGTKKQAYDYCTKDDETYQGVRIGNGEIELEDNRGKRTDLDNIADDILAGATEDEIYIKYPSSAHCMPYVRKLREMYIKREYGEKLRKNLKVYYLWGETGTGKTRFIYDNYLFKEVYRVNDYKNPFDGYNYEKVLVFDEFNGQIKIELMLTLLDIYPVQLPCRYNNKYACYDKVFIISNIDIDDQYESYFHQIRISQKNAFKRRITGIHKMKKEDNETFVKMMSPADKNVENISNDDELPF